MKRAVLAAHRHDAAVAAAKTASHDALDRYLARPSVPRGGARGRREHPFRSARIQHDRIARATRGETTIERRDDASAFASAAVFGRQDEVDVQRAKEVQIE